MINEHALNPGDFAVVTGSYNQPLVKKVAAHLGVEPVILETDNWGNGYPHCKRPEDVNFAHKKVVIITSLQYRQIGSPVEELELMFDACGSASEIHIIVTWLCGKDDVAHSAGQVSTAAWISRRIAQMRPKSVNIFDPHQSSHLELFYPRRRRRFYFLRLLIEEAKKIGIDQIAATDYSSTRRAFKVESFFNKRLPIIVAFKDHNHNSTDSQISRHRLEGEVIGKKIGLFDDMALSLATLKKSAEALKNRGAEKIYAFAAHFDPTSNAYTALADMLTQGTLTEFITTNSNLIEQKYLDLPGFKVVDVAKNVAEVVELLVTGGSTSPLFEDI